MTAPEAFVAHALKTRFEDLTDDAVAAAKTFIVDTFAVGIAGSGAPGVSAVRNAAKRMGGLNNSSTVWGRDTFATTPHAAAFANGFQIHCQEYDCVHEPAVVHPMATIFAALMAEADAKSGVSGQDLITAVAVAVDVAAGLGLAAKTPLKFFRPATAGVFGATLGVARLRGLSSEQALDAMGLALGQCSGTMQAHLEGTPALPVQIGNAARAAHLACDLAEAGLKGPHDSLEGPFSYLTLMEDAWDLSPVLSSLGTDWRIAQVSHKPFPTGRAAQGGIVLIKRLLEQGLNVGNLASLELTAPPLIHRLVGRRPKPDMSVAYARLCFAYLGARCLMSGDVGLDDFSPDRLEDPETLRLAEKIHVADNGDSNPAAFTPQIAKANLVEGQTISVETHALYGSPADPMNVDAQHLKIRKCVEFGFGEAREDIAEGLISRIAELEDEADVASLSQLAAGFKEA